MEELFRTARADKPADAVQSSVSQRKDGLEGVHDVASSALFDLSAKKVRDTGIWIPHEI